MCMAIPGLAAPASSRVGEAPESWAPVLTTYTNYGVAGWPDNPAIFDTGDLKFPQHGAE
jgi:hypothetical protein